MTGPRNTTALLFDLGGVVIDISFTRVLQSWSDYSRLAVDEIASRFSMDEPYRRHETGEIEAAEYFCHLRQTLELEASDAEIAAGWNNIFVDEIASTINHISAISGEIPCYAFTNTNPTHQQFWMRSFPKAVNAFEQVFVSSELGLRKPDRAAFEAVAAATGKRLDEILFFDDTEENVVGARAAGMPAILVNSHRDVAQAITEITTA